MSGGTLAGSSSQPATNNRVLGWGLVALTVVLLIALPLGVSAIGNAQAESGQDAGVWNLVGAAGTYYATPVGVVLVVMYYLIFTVRQLSRKTIARIVDITILLLLALSVAALAFLVIVSQTTGGGEAGLGLAIYVGLIPATTAVWIIAALLALKAIALKIYPAPERAESR